MTNTTANGWSSVKLAVIGQQGVVAPDGRRKMCVRNLVVVGQGQF